MTPLAHALCQKAIIGPILWIGSACAFPPSFSDAPIALQRQDTSVVRVFDAPVATSYSLRLVFRSPSAAAYRDDTAAGSFDGRYCGPAVAAIPVDARRTLGRPIPVHVLIREQGSGNIVLDQLFNTLCTTSHDPSTFTRVRTIATVHLDAGRYVAEVRNVDAQAGIAAATTVMLGPGDGK